MYYKNQNKKLSDKEWMESVISQMGFKNKRIDEQQPAAQQQQQPAQAQQPAAPAAAPSKTMTDFFTTINSMSQMLGGKTAMPTDPKQSQAFNANLASLGKLFPAFQAEMQKAQKAQAQQPAPAAAQQPQQAQAQQPAAQQPQQAQAQQPQR